MLFCLYASVISLFFMCCKYLVMDLIEYITYSQALLTICLYFWLRWSFNMVTKPEWHKDYTGSNLIDLSLSNEIISRQVWSDLCCIYISKSNDDRGIDRVYITYFWAWLSYEKTRGVYVTIIPWWWLLGYVLAHIFPPLIM